MIFVSQTEGGNITTRIEPVISENQTEEAIMRLQEDTRPFYTSKPILVNIYRDGDLFFVENENLVICGTGHTPQEALKDLSQHIIHFLEYYKNLDKSKLIGDALRLKRLSIDKF